MPGITDPIVLLLVIIGVALVLFSLEWIPADVTSLGVLAAISLAGLLPPGEAFAGFGNPAVMMILGLFILTAALVRNGLVEIAGSAILQRTGHHPRRLLATTMIAAATMSAFISNTATTAFFVPITMGLAHKAKLAVSRLLLPLAFSSILASSVTLVSSSTNIVVSGLMTQHGMRPIGMFELTLVGLPIAVAGLAYMYLVGWRLIPERKDPGSLQEEFARQPYITEVLLLPDSPLVGKTLSESNLGRDMDLTVLRVVRGGRPYRALDPSLRLAEGDALLVEGQRDQLLKIKHAVGIEFKADVRLSDPSLQSSEVALAEVILLPKSPLIGRSLKRAGFRERYGLQVLGINHRGRLVLRKISQIPLSTGDQLLVQGPRESIAALGGSDAFRVIGTVEYKRPVRRRALTAVGIFAGVVLVTAANLVALPVAVLLGSLAAFLTGCITPEEAYREVEWKALIVIGCMLSLGMAMERTGAAGYLAAHIVALLGGAHPVGLLSAFFALTIFLTQPMSNQAAAAVVFPVAIAAAMQLGLNPRTFAVMIAVAASCSYLTPLEPSCLMVYGPGRYRFRDFLIVGAPLTLLVYGLAILLVPRLWPL